MKQLIKILSLIVIVQGICGCEEDREQVPSCTPVCNGMECGTDGCGGSCGLCSFGTICYYGKCQSTSCVPNCDGNLCIPACEPNTQICQNGQCVDLSTCQPDCTGKACGPDGCGGLCGLCSDDRYCSGNQCLLKSTCTPDCTGKNCGDNGCGGLCGLCTDPMTCVSGTCQIASCVSYCTGRTCGSDGCGGSCGSCSGNSICDDSTGRCIPWRVTGKLMIETKTVYYDRYQLPKLDKSVDIPGYQIPLSLRDKDGNEIGKTIVAEDGTFSIEMDRLPIATDWLAIIPNWYVNGQLKFGLVVASVNQPYLSWVWSLPLSEYGKNGNYSDLGTIRVTEARASGGLYLYQQMVQAYTDLTNLGIVRDLSEMPSMAVAWSPGITWSCGTCFVNNQPTEIGKVTTKTTMYVGGATSEESVWGYPTLLHEFGHYVLATVYRDSTPGGTHNLSSPCDPQLAWSEGFATFYSMMIQSLRTGVPVSQYWRVLGTGSYWVDYAHLYEESGFGSIIIPKPSLESSKLMKQDLGEAWVTYMLYNFWDGLDIPDPTLPGDDICLGTQGILGTLASKRYMSFELYASKNYNRKTYGVDFIDFTDALVCGASSDVFTIITDYIIENGFPYDLEPVCK